MPDPLTGALRDPGRLLDAAVEWPLHPGGEAATARLLDRAAVDADTRVLDVGCGAGAALALARDRGARAVGLDRNPSGPDAVRGDMTALPLRSESVDVVLAECVLCLSPDLVGTLSEVERVLRPGGRLALSDVTVEGTAPDLPPAVSQCLCLDGPRERAQVRDAVDSAGFDVVNVRTHREDLLAMRDRIREAVDGERVRDLLGSADGGLAEGVRDLESAVEAGDVGYVSMVATVPD